MDEKQRPGVRLVVLRKKQTAGSAQLRGRCRREEAKRARGRPGSANHSQLFQGKPDSWDQAQGCRAGKDSAPFFLSQSGRARREPREDPEGEGAAGGWVRAAKRCCS